MSTCPTHVDINYFGQKSDCEFSGEFPLIKVVAILFSFKSLILFPGIFRHNLNEKSRSHSHPVVASTGTGTGSGTGLAAAQVSGQLTKADNLEICCSTLIRADIHGAGGGGGVGGSLSIDYFRRVYF